MFLVHINSKMSQKPMYNTINSFGRLKIDILIDSL